jgi:sulfonate transport system permease protein
MALELSEAIPLAREAKRGVSVRKLFDRHFNALIGTLTVVGMLLLWQYARALGIPGLAFVDPPTAIVAASADLLQSPIFWTACYKSFIRIAVGFLLAQVIGIPLGMLMATNRFVFNTVFPITEILRPVPPVAWIPIAIIFWPTREMSTIFIVFLGAFWIVLLNTIGGTSTIDPAYRRAALSLGSNRWHLFRYIIFPATLPSIVTGMVVGMGICWEMVVAAEMIAGDTGLGYLLWQSFEINATAQVIVCMIAIGLGGFASSALIRRLTRLLTPWIAER